MNTQEKTTESAWVDRATASRLLDVEPRAVDRLVAAGLVGKRDLPVQARYRRQDLESLARLNLVAAEKLATTQQTIK